MMTNKQEFTGTLEDWWYDEINHVIWGNIYGDSKGRFREGAYIHTSNLRMSKKEMLDHQEGDEVLTMNSRYRLGRKLQKIE